MSSFRYIGKNIPRVDAMDKATGKTLYPSDVYMKDQLFIRILRTDYPYSKIKSIDTSKAESIKGVVKILTHKDIPGLNRFGIAIQDQPVLCDDYTRYQGDAIAAVGAISDEIAKIALSKINVEYEILEPISEADFALNNNAPKLHQNGNILNEKHFFKGNVGLAIEKSDYVFDHTYQTQRQVHSFLETEAGAAYYDNSGILVIHAGGQYPHRDVLQLSRILNLPENQIRVINSPVGGGFGGKDELTVQAYLALMTYHTKMPSKIFLERTESFIAGGKRHPVKINLKTSVNKNGKLTGLKFYALSDTGGYASLGGPVFNLIIEHSGGVYYFPNSDVSGHCVYTNSGFQVAFRGFGVPQSLFALETQMDEMADKLGMDRLQFRKMNLLKKGETGVLNNDYPLSIGSMAVVKSMENSELITKPDKYKITSSKHIKRGIGFALGLQGAGLGVGLPDFANTRIKLTKDGKFKLSIGSSEMGQGNATCFVQIASEYINCDIEDIEYVLGDSQKTPDSGSATASRTIYVIGASIYKAAKAMNDKIKTYYKSNDVKIRNGKVIVNENQVETTAELANKIDLSVKGEFITPTADQCLGDGLPHIIYGYSGHIALVEVNTLTGEIEVIKGECHLDSGTVINQQGLEGQSEGGFVMGIGYALTENCRIEKGYYQNPRFSTYILPTSMDSPIDIKTFSVDIYEDSQPFGAKGIGEITFSSVAPAITNAIHDAIGKRFYSLPVSPEDILKSLYPEFHQEVRK